jgi:hypothetical protein
MASLANRNAAETNSAIAEKLRLFAAVVAVWKRGIRV